MVELSDTLLSCRPRWGRLLRTTLNILQGPHIDEESVHEPIYQDQHHLTAAEQVKLAFAYQAGAEMKALAAEFHVHRHTVAHCLQSLGIPLRRQGLREADRTEAAKLYLDGWSLSRLGEKYGCDATVVRRALLAYGVQTRRRRGWTY